MPSQVLASLNGEEMTLALNYVTTPVPALISVTVENRSATDPATGRVWPAPSAQQPDPDPFVVQVPGPGAATAELTGNYPITLGEDGTLDQAPNVELL